MIRRWIAPAMAAAGALRAQPTAARDTVSAPIADVKYEVTFLRANGASRTIDVAMTFTTGGTAPVLLSLPAWTPGAYEISNFARMVVEFSAHAASGSRPLEWDKLDFDTWRIRPAGQQSIRVRFA